MHRLDRRVRVLGRVLARMSARAGDDSLRQTRELRIPSNPLTDLLTGGTAPGVAWTDTDARGEDGRVPIRVYRSAKASTGPLPLIVYIHGGGFSVGNLDSGNWVCTNVASSVGAVVVSIDYRLAPEHRWPAGAEDCYAALIDVAERAAEFGADSMRLAMMGDSAGANLATVVCLMARDRSGPRILHQALIYPLVDLTFTTASVGINANAPILNKVECLRIQERYLDGQDPRHPHVSPLFAEDLSGIPPALIQIADNDPIRDDGARYAAALRESGVPVRLTEYVGMPHGYLTFPRLCRSAPQALAELCAEQAAALTARE